MIAMIGCGSSPAPRPESHAPPPPPPPDAAVAMAPDAAPAEPDSPLAITAIEPAIGDPEGGTFARVIGRDYIAEGPRRATIYFGTRKGDIVRFASNTEIIVQSPAGTEGEVVDVRMIFEPGGERVLRGAFTYKAKKH
jgi:hypothetical protein